MKKTLWILTGVLASTILFTSSSSYAMLMLDDQGNPISQPTPPEGIMYMTTTMERPKIWSISEKYKVQIDQAFDAYFKKIEKLPASQKAALLKTIDEKTTTKLTTVLNTSLQELPERTKDQLVMILQYIQTKVRS